MNKITILLKAKGKKPFQNRLYNYKVHIIVLTIVLGNYITIFLFVKKSLKSNKVRIKHGNKVHNTYLENEIASAKTSKEKS